MKIKIEIYSDKKELIEETVFDELEINDAFQIGQNLVEQGSIIYRDAIIPFKDARMELETDGDSRKLCIRIRYGAKP